MRPAIPHLRLHTNDNKAPSLSATALQDLKDQVHERLMRKREIDFNTGCWIWLGAWINSGGAGVMRVLGHLFNVHRVGFWVYDQTGQFDLWDTSVRVIHTRPKKCFPACFNPSHCGLVLGQSGVAKCQGRSRLGHFDMDGRVPSLAVKTAAIHDGRRAVGLLAA